MVIRTLNEIDKIDRSVCCNGQCAQGRFCPLYDRSKPDNGDWLAALVLAIAAVAVIGLLVFA